MMSDIMCNNLVWLGWGWISLETHVLFCGTLSVAWHFIVMMVVAHCHGLTLWLIYHLQYVYLLGDLDVVSLDSLEFRLFISFINE